MQNYKSKLKIKKTFDFSCPSGQPAGRHGRQAFNFRRSRTGFTLVEILVAATIIGLLSTIGVAGFQAITRSGRDAVRKSDLETIRSALEIYKSENNSYPANTGSCSVSSLAPDYINAYPVDPKAPTYSYCYHYIDNLHYNLCAHLENGGDDDYSGEGEVVECGGENQCTENCNYMVSNP